MLRCGAGGVQHHPGVARVERAASQSSEGRRNVGELSLVRNLGMHAVYGEKSPPVNLSMHAVFSKYLLVCYVRLGMCGCYVAYVTNVFCDEAVERWRRWCTVWPWRGSCGSMFISEW